MNPILKYAKYQAGPQRDRRGIVWTAVAGALALALGHIQTLEGQIVAPSAGDTWASTYDDEFNEGSLDLAGWEYDLGQFQGQLQQNTNSPANCYVSGGNLNVVAIASGSGANETYTSALIRTSALFSQTYGLIEFTAKMPVGTGLWPGVGMYAENPISPTSPTATGYPPYGPWPYSGEIDIDESPNIQSGGTGTYANGTPNDLVHAALHYEGSSGATQQQDIYYPGNNFTTAAWHTYDLEWNAPTGNTAGSLNWYLDGHLYYSISSWPNAENSEGTGEAPFNEPFYLDLNLGVGGTFGETIVPNLADGDYDFQIGYIREFEPESAGPAVVDSDVTTVPEPSSASALFLLATATLILLRPRRHGADR